MNTKQINTGILSFGMSGRVFHAPFIHSNPHFNLTAVVERTKKVAKDIYATIKSYDSVADLLADNSIELVIVNTPNHTHFQLAIDTLKAGKHVLLEKPAVENIEQLEELLAVSEQTGKKIFFYQNRRFDSHFMLAKSIIEGGQLGKITEMHIRFDRYKMELGQKVFKENNEYATSGLIYDLGPHVIDQAISLFGKPSKVFKTTAINRVGSKVPDYFHYHLRYDNNLEVFLTASLLVVDPQPALIVHGTKGTFTKTMADVQEEQLITGMTPDDNLYGIEKQANEGKLVTISSDGTRETTLLSAPKGDYNLLFDAIYENLRKGISFPISQDHIRWQIELLQAKDSNN